MRVVKEAEERRNEILDVAEELFAAKGYDNASTNDILERIGIARGTLYYHFKSKEEILDAIIARMTDRLMAKATEASQQKDRSVIERIVLAVQALNVDSKLGVEVVRQAHKPQNALMHQKMQERLLAGINPIITRLIEEGIEQGLFSTDYPAEAVEMFMLYSNVTFDGDKEQSPQQMQQKVMGFVYNLERLVGAKQGTLSDAISSLIMGGR